MPLAIGVTFFLSEGRSIWGNGGDQNCVFLCLLLSRIPGVRVFAINGGDAAGPSAALMLHAVGEPIEFVKIGDVVDRLDVLIEAGAQVEPEHVAKVQARGGKAVAYRFGNAYVIDTERVIHNKSAGSIFNDARFDAVWTNAQHVATCGSYWETCYRAPLRVLPHIWHPCFVEATRREFPPGVTFGYHPGRAKKRVAIFEPNMNIVKTCMLPMLVCENAYRARPDLLSEVYVTNAIKLKDHLTFQRFAGSLDIVRDGVCSFEARYNMPWFTAKFADVIVAHQWENGLNYAYYDALYGGYPLVHNSAMLPEGVGYRYHGFDVHEGGKVLADVLANHDARADDYCVRASEFLATVQATAPANVAAHERALHDLLDAKRAA